MPFRRGDNKEPLLGVHAPSIHEVGYPSFRNFSDQLCFGVMKNLLKERIIHRVLFNTVIRGCRISTKGIISKQE